MQILLAALLAAIPNVLLAIFSKLVTESFLNVLLTKLLLAGLRRAVKITINTVDDDLVAEIEKRLTEKPESI